MTPLEEDEIVSSPLKHRISTSISQIMKKASLENNPINKYNEEQLQNIYNNTDYFELIKGFPEYEMFDLNSLIKMQTWFRHTLYKINLNFYYNRRSKYEYTNIMRFIMIMLRDMKTAVHTTHDPSNLKAHKDKGLVTPETVDHYYLLMNESIQHMIDMYPTQFPPPTNRSDKLNRYKESKIQNILNAIDSIQLTNEQHMIMNSRFVPTLEKIRSSKTQYMLMFYVINTMIHLLSIAIPAIITIKDFYFEANDGNKCINTCKDTYEVNALKYACLATSVAMSILTNGVIFFKINQKYSVYTRFFDKIKAEIWKFVSLSDTYDIRGDKRDHDTEKLTNHEIFPIFCSNMEDIIGNMNDAVFELTLGTKNEEKDPTTHREDYYNITTLEPDAKIKTHVATRLSSGDRDGVSYNQV